MTQKIICCIAAFLVCAAANSMSAEEPLSTSSGPAAPSGPTESRSILSVDDHYMKAFNAGDADSAASDFTPDAVYVTEDGRTLKGRDDIKNALVEQFKDLQGATLKLNVYSVDFSSDKQHATERGVSVLTKDNIQEPASYVAEFSRDGGQWRISQVVEKSEAAAAEHLQGLAWMIGNWIDKSEDASIVTKSEWALDRGFIIRKFSSFGPKVRELTGIEYIGWDPEKKEIRSWYFDSAGGFGSGKWRKEGDSWIEESSGTTPRGETAGATFTFTPKDENSFTLRATNRHIGKEKHQDLPESVVRRTSTEQLNEARGQQ